MINENNLDVAISVIIPCYNSEKTIINTLFSLENQIYKNFEVIVVNDGSKDQSNKIIKKFISLSKLNINYICQENSGVSAARNKGLLHAKGKYIAFLDADDIYHKEYLVELIGVIETYNTDVSYCAYSRNIEYIKNNTNEKEIQTPELLNQQQLLNNFMYRIGPNALYTFLYRKSIIDKFNILFTVGARYGEDLEFTWKYLSHAQNGVYVSKELYGYYDNPTSAINNISWNITDALYSVKRVEKYLVKYNKEFYSSFKEYMYNRTVWSISKDFARAGNKELFNKFLSEVDVTTSMKQLLGKTKDIKIKMSILIYFLNKNLYFKLINNFYR